MFLGIFGVLAQTPHTYSMRVKMAMTDPERLLLLTV